MHIHMTFDRKAKIVEKNNLQTVQAKSEINLTSAMDNIICIDLIALYVHLKNSITIMVLDNSTLGKQIRLNFFAFDKFTLQNLANKSGDV